MEQIRALCKAKGHEDTLLDDTLLKKGFFAVIEIAEAYDHVKKVGVNSIIANWSPEMKDELATELIDSIFYILDTYGLLYRTGLFKDPDVIFDMKMAKNMSRAYRYGRPRGEELNESNRQ